MSIRGFFPAFMKQLRRQWKAEFPGLSGIPGALGSMPKASTFYAGQEPAAGRHVFVSIQESATRRRLPESGRQVESRESASATMLDVRSEEG